MRSYILLAALSTIVSASPVPQDIEFDLAYALPNPAYTTTLSSVVYDPTAILEAAQAQITSSVDNSEPTDAATLEKRDTACQPQPAGATGAPTVSTDTPAAFTSSPDFASLANNAITPSGYSLAFKNAKAASNAYGYMGYQTLQKYDVQACANKCQSINGCMSFNIYIERDPSVNPASPSCTNPKSVTMIKCSFWGGPVDSSTANNAGQYRSQFQVVIAGSNGYQNNSITTPPGYSQPRFLGNSAINAPLDSYGFNSYLGSAIFNSGPFDVALCASACSDKSKYALANPPNDGSPVATCKFFNTYILYINTTANLQGQYCAMYSETWAPQYATNVGQYRGYDHFLIEYSYTSSNVTDPGTPCKNCAVHQASKDISYSTLQPYCSSLLGYTTPLSTATVSTTTTPGATSTVAAVATSTIFVKRDGAPALRTPNAIPDKRDATTTSIIQRPPPAAVNKRAAATVLTQYPPEVVSSACSLQATPVSVTSITTSTVVVTAATTYTTVTSYSSTSTFTSTTSVPSPTPFQLQVSGGPYDTFWIGLGGSGIYTVSALKSQKADALAFTIDPSTGYLHAGNLVANQDAGNSYQQPLFLNDPSTLNGVQYAVCSVNAGTLTCSDTRGSLFSYCDAGAAGFSSDTPYLLLDSSTPNGCYTGTLNVILI